MRKMPFLLMGLILFSTVFVFCGCSSNQPASTIIQTATITQTVSSSQPAPTAALSNATPPSGYVLVTSVDGNVSIFAPSGWNTNATQLYPGSVIGVADSASNEFLIITQKPKTTLKADDTVNDYLNIVKTAFGSAITSPVWGEPSNVTIGGCKGLSMRATGIRKSNGTATVYFINALESKNYFYNVCGYTLTSSEATSKPVLEKIINSFKEKD
jgi:hypothetical protein